MDPAQVEALLAQRRQAVAAKAARRLRELVDGDVPASELDGELHRLAGTLGSFGLVEASIESRALMNAVRAASVPVPHLVARVRKLADELDSVETRP